MAAGNMLQAGLGKARGLWAGVLWGAGLAGGRLVRSPAPGPATPRTLPFSGLQTQPPPRPRLGLQGGGGRRAPPPAHPPERPHHSVPSREDRSALSGRVTAQMPTPRPEPRIGDPRCVFSLGSCGRVRRGTGKTGCARTAPADGGGARGSAPLHPWAAGPGTPRLPRSSPSPRARRLTAGRGVERGPGSGAHSHPWRLHSGAPGGAGSGALRSPCGPEPGRSLVFRGTQPQTRTPREGRSGAGAGAARGGGGRGARVGRLGLAARRRSSSRASPRPLPPAPRRPARPPSPVPLLPPLPRAPFPAAASPYPGAARIPSPSAWLRSPRNFSEGRLSRKAAKRTKTQGEGGNAQVPVRPPALRPLPGTIPFGLVWRPLCCPQQP